ncbi:MAG: polyphosphate kinase 1 [Treponema sp.]|jgi:polyphosphate kinase|nr:polyphosphate kinase 1 [Treponema sp.]
MEKETELPSNPAVYFNRDLSWVDFNERVMEEAMRKDLPLFERFRFLTIGASNFDEFFMVRVAAIKRAQRAGFSGDPSGLSPAEQLKKISEKIRSINRRTLDCLFNDIFPSLAAGGLELVRPDSYTVPQMDYLESFFLGQVFPVLTPLRIEEDKPLPFFDSHCINTAFLLASEASSVEPGSIVAGAPVEDAAERIVMVPFPASLSRIVWLPPDGDKLRWALLDDMMLVWGGYLFPGYRVRESMLFKVNRDADFSVDERRDEDFIEAMEEVIEGREKSEVVRIVYSPGSGKLRDELAKRLSLESDDLYEYDGPFNAGSLLELSNVAGFEQFQEKPWKIHPAPGFTEDVSIWDRLSQGDVMLHFPYQSFDPVVRFFQEAAADPQVISIKTALYRTGGSAGNPQAISPIVRALEQAALNGKHVTALVELKARFDEERNISWANRLEKAGVIVVYGLSRLKVHAKITMVLRREHERIRRYVHLSTGNYNDKTAKAYEDLCLFTCREDIAYDASLLFNMITGYSLRQAMQRLAIAPYSLKPRILELIERETKRSDQKYPSKIMMKCNSVTDMDIINALYRASRAGVKISLCVRGICALVPGVPGLSENIKVISVIDRYLEHSRVYYFTNGGAEELYLASADLMPRNLERRVEIMFPIQDEKIRAELTGVLNAYFSDNCQARVLDSAGAWKRMSPSSGETPFRVQKDMLSRAARDSDSLDQVKQEFIVRRSAAGA